MNCVCLYTCLVIYLYYEVIHVSGNDNDIYDDIYDYDDDNSSATPADKEPANASIQDYPYMVSVQRDKKHICGGTLYTVRLVLTAAHCCFRRPVVTKHRLLRTWRYAINTLSVVLGSSLREDWDDTYQRRGVLLSFPHQNYDSWGRNNKIKHDIALLLLSHPIELSATVQLVSLKTSKESDPPPGTVCTTIGWGVVTTVKKKGCFEDDKTPSKTLQKIDVNLKYECPTNYWLSKCCQPARHVCATWRGGDICMGDSGSPLICDGKQLGLVGKACAMICPGYYYRLDRRVQELWLKEGERRIQQGVGSKVQLDKTSSTALLSVWILLSSSF